MPLPRHLHPCPASCSLLFPLACPLASFHPIELPCNNSFFSWRSCHLAHPLFLLSFFTSFFFFISLLLLFSLRAFKHLFVHSSLWLFRHSALLCNSSCSFLHLLLFSSPCVFMSCFPAICLCPFALPSLLHTRIVSCSFLSSSSSPIFLVQYIHACFACRTYVVMFTSVCFTFPVLIVACLPLPISHPLLPLLPVRICVVGT